MTATPSSTAPPAGSRAAASRTLRRGYFSRSRGLAHFGSLFPLACLHQGLARGGAEPVRALEVGCGEGRALMELYRVHPAVEFHGTNKEPWPAMRGSASLRRTAEYHRIFPPRELRKLPLPAIHFCDAERLPFADATFDLVVSQMCFPYVVRKDRAIEEVWRVLRVGGRAFLHLDVRNAAPPDFLRSEAPRFILVERDGHPLAPVALFEEARRRGYDLSYRAAGLRVTLAVHRTRPEPLALNLRLDEMSSFDLGLLRRGDPDPVFWGYRSLFMRA
jgi:SAM-dependent methyltransferase